MSNALDPWVCEQMQTKLQNLDVEALRFLATPYSIEYKINDEWKILNRLGIPFGYPIRIQEVTIKQLDVRSADQIFIDYPHNNRTPIRRYLSDKNAYRLTPHHSKMLNRLQGLHPTLPDGRSVNVWTIPHPPIDYFELAYLQKVEVVNFFAALQQADDERLVA